jgi:hypothetical protein
MPRRMATAQGAQEVPTRPPDSSFREFVYFGYLAGIAGLLSIVVDFATPSASTAAGQLSSFQSNPVGYTTYLFPLAFAFLVTPFFVYLGSKLSALGSEVARPATQILLLALFSLGIAGAFEYGGYWAASVTSAPSPAIQAYEAAFWSNINNAWELVSIYGVAMGSFLLAWSLGRTKGLPTWMPKLGWVGGALDLLGAVLASLSGYYGGLSVGFVLPVFGLIILVVFAFTIPKHVERLAADASPLRSAA